MEWGIIFLTFFAPLALGSVFPWAYGFMETIVFIFIGFWLFRWVIGRPIIISGMYKERTALIEWAWIWPFLLLLLVLIQIIPLPSRFLRIISPYTYQVYLPIISGKFRTISLDRFATWSESLKILAYMGLFFIIIYYPFKEPQRSLRHICLGAMSTGVVIGILGLSQRFTGTDRIFWMWKPFIKKDKSFYGPFVNPNHFAVYMEMIIGLFLGYILFRFVKEGGNKKGRRFKIWIVDMERFHSKSLLLFFLMIILTLSLFFSMSRGGMVIILGAFLFFFLMVILRHRHKKGVMVIGIYFCLIFLLFLSYLGMESILKEFYSLFQIGKDVSAHSRILVWKDVWKMIKAFPLFGVGLGGFGSIFTKFVTLKGRLGRFAWLYVHNDYLQLWAELGLGGLILLCIGMAIFVIGIIRWVRCEESSSRSIEAEHYLVLGCYTAIFCFLIHSLIEYSFYIPSNMVIFVVICGVVVRMQKDRVRPQEYFYIEKNRVFRGCSGILLGMIVVLIIIALMGGYGQGEYQFLYNKGFQEKVFREVPMARCMPLWNNSPYRYYFLARWNEKKGFSDNITPEEQKERLERAINEISKAIDLQPSRSLFWSRLGYLMSHLSSLSPDFCFSFPGSDQALSYQDAFVRALYFSPNNARLHYQIGSYLWKMGGSFGLSLLQKAMCLNPSYRRRIERLLKS